MDGKMYDLFLQLKPGFFFFNAKVFTLSLIFFQIPTQAKESAFSIAMKFCSLNVGKAIELIEH